MEKMTNPDDGDESVPVEFSPDRRFERYKEELGRGACKRVFKAFDTREGREVAWNKVELTADLGMEARKLLLDEIRVLRSLSHKNVMGFHDFWVDSLSQTLNFITELFVSGTLRQYRRKQGSKRPISLSIIIRWAYQILEGLIYLHAHVPPIIHRDLKCDNIFVNSNDGVIKIGDLGLATAQHGMSVVGTPEFMAPEIFEEDYDEKVDIYSFGMCLLELSTGEYPYSECKSVAQIYRKVTSGCPPGALGRVIQDDLRQLIEICTAMDPKTRPSARLLLKHPLFDSLRAEALKHHGHSYASLTGLASAFNSKPGTPAVTMMSKQIKKEIASAPNPAIASPAAGPQPQVPPILAPSSPIPPSRLIESTSTIHKPLLPLLQVGSSALEYPQEKLEGASSEGILSSPHLRTESVAADEMTSPDWKQLADEANGSRVYIYSTANPDEQGPHLSPQRRNSIQVAALLHTHKQEEEGNDSDDEAEVIIPLHSLIQIAAQEEAFARGSSMAGSSSSNSLARPSAFNDLATPKTFSRSSTFCRCEPGPITATSSSETHSRQHTSFSGRGGGVRGVIVKVSQCEALGICLPGSAGHRRSRSWV